MPRQINFDYYNITGMMAKPLYMGMALNVLLPAALTFVCYWLDNGQKYTNAPFGGDSVNTIFIISGVLTLILAAIALIKKQQLLNKKLVTSENLINDQLTEALTKEMRPIFLMISLIALVGVGSYFMTAEFKPTLFFVMISFVVFQFVRPRTGFIKKLIEKQLDMLGN